MTKIQNIKLNTNSGSSINGKEVREEVRKIQSEIVEAFESNDLAKVSLLQKALTESFSGRAIAVQAVYQSKGRNTPGVDGFSMDKISKEELINLINMLSDTEKYKSKPVKRVYIPKANGKLRPLGIPTIYDRCVQMLFSYALAPIAESIADEHSFGFRPARSTKDAIAVLGNGLYYKVMISKFKKDQYVYYPSQLPRYVIDADIKGFFDNISHEGIIKNIPLDKKVLEQFLKAGYMDKGKFIESNKGVPQGGVISPIIANMVLDGLEKQIGNMLLRRRIMVPGTFVRYADDFVVVVPQEGVIKPIMEVINNFLKPRGIELSKEKTVIVDMLKDKDGFKFLGVLFHRPNRTMKSLINKFTVLQAKTSKPEWDKTILIYKPHDSKVDSLLKKVRELILSHKNEDISTLVEALNPVLRGWFNYFRSTNATNTFSMIDGNVGRYMLKGGKKKHTTKSKKFIMDKYCLTLLKEKHARKAYFGYESNSKKVFLFLISRGGIKYHVDVCKNLNYYELSNSKYFQSRLSSYGDEKKSKESKD